MKLVFLFVSLVSDSPKVAYILVLPPSHRFFSLNGIFKFLCCLGQVNSSNANKPFWNFSELVPIRLLHSYEACCTSKWFCRITILYTYTVKYPNLWGAITLLLNNYTSLAYVFDMAENPVWNFHSLNPEVEDIHSAHCLLYNTRDEAIKYSILLEISSPNRSVIYSQVSHSDMSYFFFPCHWEFL